jgi:hypothetical protein
LLSKICYDILDKLERTLSITIKEAEVFNPLNLSPHLRKQIHQVNLLCEQSAESWARSWRDGIAVALRKPEEKRIEEKLAEEKPAEQKKDEGKKSEPFPVAEEMTSPSKFAGRFRQAQSFSGYLEQSDPELIRETTTLISDFSPFQLHRFPEFIDLVIQQSERLLDDKKKEIMQEVKELALKFFNRTSESIALETSLKAIPVTVRFTCKSKPLIDKIIYAFVERSNVILDLKSQLNSLAKEVKSWLETCSEERKICLKRMEEIDQALKGIDAMMSSV